MGLLIPCPEDLTWLRSAGTLIVAATVLLATTLAASAKVPTRQDKASQRPRPRNIAAAPLADAIRRQALRK